MFGTIVWFQTVQDIDGLDYHMMRDIAILFFANNLISQLVWFQIVRDTDGTDNPDFARYHHNV